MTANDDQQRLVEPTTQVCQLALITRSKARHAVCNNRQCGCICHTSSAYGKSWKVH